MCNAYGLQPDSYNYRIKHGWDSEEALTTPKSKQRKTTNLKHKPPKSSKRICSDHEGNKFSSQKAMRKAYGVSSYRFSSMLKEGYSMGEALRGREVKKIPCRRRKDHLGKELSPVKKFEPKTAR